MSKKRGTKIRSDSAPISVLRGRCIIYRYGMYRDTHTCTRDIEDSARKKKKKTAYYYIYYVEVKKKM